MQVSVCECTCVIKHDSLPESYYVKQNDISADIEVHGGSTHKASEEESANMQEVFTHLFVTKHIFLYIYLRIYSCQAQHDVRFCTFLCHFNTIPVSLVKYGNEVTC